MASATSIKLDDEMKDRVLNLARVRQRTSHWIMREAIAQYVVREERREALRLETLQAWQDFQDDGLHATGEEIDRWLSTWGTDDETPAPACHS